MKIKAFILVLCVYSVLYGQQQDKETVSGYLGKKHYIELSSDFFPARNLFWQDNLGYNVYTSSSDYPGHLKNQLFDWDGNHFVKYGAVVKNDLVLENGLGMKSDVFYSIPAEVLLTHAIADSYRYTQLKINSVSYTFGLKKFILGGIAPYGKYFLINLSLSRIHITDNGEYYYGNFPVDIKDFDVQLQLGFGTQKILWDKIVFDWALTIGLDKSSLSYMHELIKVKDSRIEEYTMTPLEFSYKRYLHFHSLYNFKIGIGYLF